MVNPGLQATFFGSLQSVLFDLKSKLHTMENILNQFTLSLNNLIDKLGGWVDSLVLSLPNILLAALVMGLSVFFSRYVSRYFSKLVGRFSRHKTVNKLLTSIATAGFMLIMIFIVLGILNLDTALKSMLAGAGVAGLAIGLALQEPLVNLFSGIMMSVREYFKIGDLVETNGFTGNIKQISLRSTVLRTFQGQEVVIPNKMVHQQPLKNYTASGERRVDLACGVSYGDDLEKVKQVAIQAIEENIEYDNDKPVQLFFTEFGNSSINFSLRFWLDQCRQPDFMEAQSSAIMALKKAFDANDITIPFPIRTLDFGAKGGEKLNEMISFRQLQPDGGGAAEDN
jgi:small conductance mechanosensitive channel